MGVADTQTALWHLLGDDRLSVFASLFLEETDRRGGKIAVSSISLVEIVYLVDQRRVPLAAYLELVSALADPEHLLTEQVLSAQVAERMRGVSRDEVPDMPDRIVAATGIYLAVPVISRDGKIRGAHLTTIW
jgi:PIN domain nuclease of toxin-antitoxin system